MVISFTDKGYMITLFEQKLQVLDKDTLVKIIVNTLELIGDEAPDPSEYQSYVDEWSN